MIKMYKIIISVIFLLGLMTACFKSEDVPEVAIVDPSEFTQKLLIEDFTGTWCVYCTGAGDAIHKAVHGTNGNDRFIPIGIHFRSLTIQEEMQNQYSEALVASFNPNKGFPLVILNRAEAIWADDYLVSSLESKLNRYAPVGLAINSTLTGNSIDITVKVGFVEEMTVANNYKLVVYLVEDGLIYPQYNGSLPEFGEIIEDYVHNDVLRYAFTNVLGDAIPNTIASDHRYTQTFSSVNLPNTIANTSNTRIVAFVVDANDNCLNVQMADVGMNQDFD